MDSIKTELAACRICPRECGVNRLAGELGYCKTGAEPLVASITLHRGEEPVLSGNRGVCNVFFSHCNLRCDFCQNYQISRNASNDSDWITDYNEINLKIREILDTGVKTLGFVSPSHQVPQMIQIISTLRQQGYSPIVVYNTNGYDSVKTIRRLSDWVDVYLPDIKYFDNKLASKYSDAKNYFAIAINALKEMIWQKGTSIPTDDNGIAESGVIVRHMVLPGHAADSIKILQELSELSINLTISLMSQYQPLVCNYAELNRTLKADEYNVVVRAMHSLGFYRGWTQAPSSKDYYLPNFSEKNPFSD